MPTPTYDLIEEKVLGSATASVTFSSIPGTYKDLVLEYVGSTSSNVGETTIRFNSDSGSNYSRTRLYGDGSSTGSGRTTNDTAGIVPWSSTAQCMQILNIQSYANTNVNKTTIYTSKVSSIGVDTGVFLWRSTAAITAIQMYVTGVNFNTGCTFRLWGVSG